jgi:hypothetical protein
MFSQKFLYILQEVNEYINPSVCELNNDFLTLYNHYIILYSRNIFKYRSNWKKMERDYDVDYDYINTTNCEKDILYIQKMLRFYANIFNYNIKNKSVPDYTNLLLYETFIKQEIDILITKIIKPFPIRLQSIKEIIEKYTNILPVKKSKKINYEVFDKMQIMI